MKRTHITRLTFLVAASIGAACNFIFPLDGLQEPVTIDASAPPLLDGGIDGSRCPSGQTLCGSECRDLSSDPANCGACGEVCKQTSCTSSFCEPRVFLGEKGVSDKLVVDGQTVYWMVRTPDSSRVFSVKLDDLDAGVDKRTVLPVGQYDLALSGGKLLTRDSRAVYLRPVGFRTNTDDGGTSEQVRVTAPEQLVGFAPFLDGTNARLLYVVSTGDDLVGRSTVAIGDDAGLLRTQFTATFSEPQRIYDLTIDQLEAYFISEGSSGANIVRATKIGPGGGNVTFVVRNIRPGGLAFSPNGMLAWTDENVVVTSRSGTMGTVVERSRNNETYSDLAYPGPEVYYLVTSERQIRRASLEGGAPVAVGTADQVPSSVAVTPEYVMWIRGGNLVLLRR